MGGSPGSRRGPSVSPLLSPAFKPSCAVYRTVSGREKLDISHSSRYLPSLLYHAILLFYARTRQLTHYIQSNDTLCGRSGGLKDDRSILRLILSSTAYIAAAVIEQNHRYLSVSLTKGQWEYHSSEWGASRAPRIKVVHRGTSLKIDFPRVNLCEVCSGSAAEWVERGVMVQGTLSNWPQLVADC
ncbi:hypothetical protein EYF80_016892 [Liparis tanakae]|uniref:Uncharacterized protein n=1 Tax=Liparis tanakae TaxID=230148 RepID=A0A4Z2I710_9TELE|nr:hypothetical protein EYF80_016892 [Liparis tanakae]